MSARRNLENVYFWLQRLIVPGLRYSQYFYEELLESLVRPDTAWLDLGCGHHVLPPWRRQQEYALTKSCALLVGIDYDTASLRKYKSIHLLVRGDITKLPFADAAFDLITCNMVIEHVADPEQLFAEANRVLRENGLFVLHTPNKLGYGTIFARVLPQPIKHALTFVLQGRGEEDVFRTCYRANDRATLCKLAQHAGFTVERLRLLNSSALFGVVPPLVVFELIWIRLLMTKSFRPLRTNIMAVLRKSQSADK